MSDFTIAELAIPETLDGPGGADFVEMVDVRNAIETHTYGGEDLNYSASELLPGWQNEYEPRRLLLPRVDGHIVGRGIYNTRPDGSADVAYLTVEVLPEFRGRGIGSALLEQLEGFADAEGRHQREIWGLAKEIPGERLDSPTGFGSLPMDDPGVRFLRKGGWSLEQVERSSKLVLPLEPELLAEHLAAASTASGPDYRVHTWVDRTPPQWLEDIAMLATRMSTDTPTAGMDDTEDVWTVQRVLDAEEREASSPRRQLVAAVEHVPSGHLVGYTELSVPAELERAVSQEDTIVLKEHRGHRLGMLLKVANIAHLTDTFPGHPSVTTFNAEENRHMLSVNEAVGFVAVGYEGAWKKVVAR